MQVLGRLFTLTMSSTMPYGDGPVLRSGLSLCGAVTVDGRRVAFAGLGDGVTGGNDRRVGGPDLSGSGHGCVAPRELPISNSDVPVSVPLTHSPFHFARDCRSRLRYTSFQSPHCFGSLQWRKLPAIFPMRAWTAPTLCSRGISGARGVRAERGLAAPIRRRDSALCAQHQHHPSS
eukprot:SAG31_NODE_648_length_13204_cov_57.612908_9_plen_176_part_00